MGARCIGLGCGERKPYRISSTLRLFAAVQQRFRSPAQDFCSRVDAELSIPARHICMSTR